MVTSSSSDLNGLQVTGHGRGAGARLEVGFGVIFPGWSVGGGEVIHRVHLRERRTRDEEEEENRTHQKLTEGGMGGLGKYPRGNRRK